MDQKQIKKELSSTDFFTDLSAKELDLFLKKGRLKKFKKDDFLVSEDQQGKDVFIILGGRVEIELKLPDSGRAQVIATLNKGELLGELILLGYVRRSASARAKDDVLAIQWTKDDLQNIFEKNYKVGYQVMFNLSKVLARRLTATNMELRNVVNKMIDFA